MPPAVVVRRRLLGPADVGVEDALVAQFARRLDGAGQRGRRRLRVEHVAVEGVRRRVHDERAVSDERGGFLNDFFWEFICNFPLIFFCIF